MHKKISNTIRNSLTANNMVKLRTAKLRIADTITSPVILYEYVHTVWNF